MEVGSLVEVSFGGRQLFGVVRWCGKPRNKSEQGLVGVELVQLFLGSCITDIFNKNIFYLFQECDIDEGSDGSYLGQQFFRCAPGRGVFVPFRHCRADSRFSSSYDVSRTSLYERNHDLPSEIGIDVFYFISRGNLMIRLLNIRIWRTRMPIGVW